MDPQLVEESKRITRYTVVRWVSRGSDLLVGAVVLWMLGLGGVLVAYGASVGTNWLVDFVGQKFWAFRDPGRTGGQLLKEALLYLGVRGLNVSGAALTFYLLHFHLGFKAWSSLLIVLPIFWATGFFLYRQFIFCPKPAS